MLGFVETVYFVDKQNGGAALLQCDFGFVDGFADVFYAGKYGGNGQELSVETLCQNPRQGGFAYPRRPPQQHGMRFAAFQRHPQRFAGAD